MDMKRVICVVLILCFLCATGAMVACGEKPAEDGSTVLAEWKKTYTAGSFGIVSEEDPFVLLEVEGYGDIRLELFPSVAPISVQNFLKYVEDGFYDGVVFHRVIKDFMIQTGGFTQSGDRIVQKTPTYPNIKGEFTSNGVANYLKHSAGVLSMARGNAKDSGSSQFFICATRYPSLDGNYAAFGRVIDEESMAVVSAIEKVETGESALYYGDTPVTSSDVPVETVKIKKMKVVQK